MKKKYSHALKAIKSAAEKPQRSRETQRWEDLRGDLSSYDLTKLRQFAALAAKFLLPIPRWDDSHPETEFDKHAVIQDYHAGFDQMKGREMANPTGPFAEFVHRLRLAAGFQGCRLSPRRALKKLTVLRKRMARFFRDFKMPAAGCRYYVGELKCRYYDYRPHRERNRHKRDVPPCSR